MLCQQALAEAGVLLAQGVVPGPIASAWLRLHPSAELEPLSSFIQPESVFYQDPQEACMVSGQPFEKHQRKRVPPHPDLKVGPSLAHRDLRGKPG